MTRRERVLLGVLCATVLGALVLLGTQAWLDHLASLGQTIVKWQKTSALVQRQLMDSSAASPKTSPSRLVSRLTPKDEALEPMTLAALIRTEFVKRNVTIQEFQVITSDKAGFALKYTLFGPVTPFFLAAQALWQVDKRLVVTGFSMVERGSGVYTMVWEVGHASTP